MKSDIYSVFDTLSCELYRLVTQLLSIDVAHVSWGKRFRSCHSIRLKLLHHPLFHVTDGIIYLPQLNFSDLGISHFEYSTKHNLKFEKIMFPLCTLTFVLTTPGRPSKVTEAPRGSSSLTCYPNPNIPQQMRVRVGLGESVSNVCPTSFDEIDPTQAFCTRIPQLVPWWGGVGHETSWSNYFFRSVDKFFQGVNKLAHWQVVMTERTITK